jgi:hypothetical protein
MRGSESAASGGYTKDGAAPGAELRIAGFIYEQNRPGLVGYIGGRLWER